MSTQEGLDDTPDRGDYLSYSEALKELHKLSIRVGCPSSEFWDEDTDLFWNYVEVFTEDRQSELDEKFHMMDYSAWLNGSYIVHALNNFGIMVKKPQAYPSEPFHKSRQDKEKEKTQPTTNKVTEAEKQQNELMAALLSYNQVL